ncbi:hypothetical protein BJ170DRAFT_628962 [Xylariales sp. AK1849]|nr:hypothetical protein BJ170DRAFT_628962 [Xylariales sp. AK1849]
MPRMRQSSTISSLEDVDAISATQSKAAIRVSKACVQCRSKHVRCDATTPACMRCTMSRQPCFYAKSRRGIRDPKKRSLISDKPPTLLDTGPLLNLPDTLPAQVPSHYLYDLSGLNLDCHRSASPTREENSSLNAYFTYFHPSHSVLLPKRFFLKHAESYPTSMDFLLSVVKFMGSLYLSRVSSEELREAAFAAACGPLPMTPQSVQGLLILSIAALGEMKIEYQNGWMNRAISMALEIGMQHKVYADTTSDPVLAESYRRTYWGLFTQDCVRDARDCMNATPLHELLNGVDLPCEEWEYDTGRIPQPISLAQYDVCNNLVSAQFSSWAYLVDLCRISSNLILPYNDAPEEKKAELFERADSRICDWLIRVPRWKMDLVDPNGVSDMILFHSIAFAQQNRLKIRQCAARQSLDLRQCFPLGPARGPHRQAQKVKGFGWNAIPIEVQAANSICELFRHSFPIEGLSPHSLPGLLGAALAYLDACVFLGLDTPAVREKLNMLLHILTVHGETWAISRKIAEEVREVAREYLSLPHSRNQTSCGDAWMAPITTGSMSEDVPFTANFDFPLYPEVNHLDHWTTPSNDQSINV